MSAHPQPGEGGPTSRGIFSPELLERCISCGFCLPACPTYQLTKDEDSSPRGRINLMRALEDGTLADDDPTVVEESSFCLGCRACEPVCPAGVRYGAMLEEWRDHTWTRRRRPLKLRALLWAVDRRWRVRAMGAVRGHARRGGDGAAGDGAAGEAPQLLLGCFERALYPKVSRAVRRIAPEVRVTPAQGCCGALHAHNGELERGRGLAERLGEELPGPILTTAGGCAAHLAGMLGRDRVRELSEWLAERDGAPGETAGATAGGGEARAGGKRLRVGLQDSCHLRNGMHVWLEPRALIARVAEYVELPTAASCCGAAGTYATLRPDDSGRILDGKLDEIEAAGLDVVVAVNPGCLRQLQQGLRRRRLRTRAMHLAELLAEHAGAR